MTRFPLVLPILGLLAATAVAQETPSRPVVAAARQRVTEARAFYKTLNLTPEQQAKRKAITARYQPKLVAVLEKYSRDRTAYSRSKKTKADLEKHNAVIKKMQAESGPLMTQYQKELEAIYTPEQRAKVKAYAEQMKKRAAAAKK